MLSLLFIVLLILCGSITLSVIFDRKIGQSILLYFLFIIFSLYVFGIFIPLNIVFYITLFVTLLGFIVVVFKKGKKVFNVFKCPSLYLFLIFSLVLFLLDSGKGLHIIDEYTHWGDIVYAMFQNNVLSVVSINDAWYASYPPAISLFEYFIMMINGSFSEGILYFGYQLFGISLFLPFVDKIRFNSKIHFVIIFVVLLVMPFMLFGNYYNSIYVDAVMGMFFGFTFVYPYIYKKFERFDVFFLSLCLFVLTLMKDAGLFLSIVSLINLFLIMDKRDKKRYFMIAGIFVISVLCAKISWNLLIYFNGVSISHEGTFTFKALFDALCGTGSEIKVDIRDKFISTFSSSSVLNKPLNLTYFSLTMLFCLILYFVYKEDKRYFKSLVLLALCSFVYMFGLLIIFMFNFADEEALGLLSYDRYSMIYLNGMLFFITASVIVKFQKLNKIVLASLILLFFVPTGSLTNLIYNNTDKNRNEFVNYVSKIESGKKVLVFSSVYGKIEYAKYHYMLRPIKLTENCNGSCISHSEKVLKDKNYDYLYIDKIDKEILIDGVKMKNSSWYKVEDDKVILDINE